MRYLAPLVACLAIAGCGGDEGEGEDIGLEVGACTTARSVDSTPDLEVVSCDDARARSKVVKEAEELQACRFNAISGGKRYCLEKTKRKR
ncbi:MAG: hypothetical protein H0V29_06600 [Thermoleophilaceae bacterium]|nr:hypothetical protein [Thermoleophilaceae bacterium]